MIKLMLIIMISLPISYSAIAESDVPSGWADMVAFCENTTDNTTDESKCISMIESYQKATEKHFSELSVKKLQKISDYIDGLSNKNSANTKQLVDAVDDIGDTLRTPIEIPAGVRSNNVMQQQYMQQSQ